MSKHGNNPDIKIEISYRGRLYVRGIYRGEEIILICNGGVQLSEALPVNIEEADAIAALYHSAIHQYRFITENTDERTIEAVWGDHHNNEGKS